MQWVVLAVDQRSISTLQNIARHGWISLSLLLAVLLVLPSDINETLVNIEWCAIEGLNL